MEQTIKSIERCIENAIEDYESIYYKKDKYGKPDILEEDMARLLQRFASKFKTITGHTEKLKEQIQERKEAIRKLLDAFGIK